MRPQRITPGQRVDFKLTPGERDLIIGRTFIDAELEERLRATQTRGSRLVVRLTLDDVDDLAGHVAAEANHCEEPRVRRALESVYDRLAHIEARFTDEQAGQVAVIEARRPFTAKQGQYLAFIYYYAKIHGTPPAEADFRRFFRVTPPVVHQKIKTLQARGYIDREPGKARSIKLRLTRDQLPDLE
jgi:repressor LexA